jgi:hypothetical protein
VDKFLKKKNFGQTGVLLTNIQKFWLDRSFTAVAIAIKVYQINMTLRNNQVVIQSLRAYGVTILYVDVLLSHLRALKLATNMTIDVTEM